MYLHSRASEKDIPPEKSKILDIYSVVTLWPESEFLYIMKLAHETRQ